LDWSVEFEPDMDDLSRASGLLRKLPVISTLGMHGGLADEVRQGKPICRSGELTSGNDPSEWAQRGSGQYPRSDSDYFVIRRWAGEVAAGASGEIANVSQVFQP